MAHGKVALVTGGGSGIGRSAVLALQGVQFIDAPVSGGIAAASAGTLIVYFICCLGVLRLRARNIVSDGAAFRVPFGPVIPLLACAIIVWLLTTLSPSELVAAAAFILLVGLAYGAQEFRRLKA